MRTFIHIRYSPHIRLFFPLALLKKATYTIFQALFYLPDGDLKSAQTGEKTMS
jgi:hypothetical protein